MERDEKQLAPESAASRKRIQVNTDLWDDLADAFERYRDETGLLTNAPAVRALLIPRLRELGYLPALASTEALAVGEARSLN